MNSNYGLRSTVARPVPDYAYLLAEEAAEDLEAEAAGDKVGGVGVAVVVQAAVVEAGRGGDVAPELLDALQGSVCGVGGEEVGGDERNVARPLSNRRERLCEACPER